MIRLVSARRRPPPRSAAISILCVLALTRCTSDQSPTQNQGGPPPPTPGDTTGTPGDTTGTPGDTTGTPGDTTAASAIFLGAGDIAGCTHDYRAGSTVAILQRPENLKATVFTLGDNAYPDGSQSDYHCYDATWGAVKDRTRPVPGNHEYHQAGAAPYFAYFGAAAGDPAKGYYSYDLAGWHIVALNSEQGLVEELSWLKSDLAEHPSQCTLAYWHRPFFTSGVNHPSAHDMRPFWDALYAAGAEIVLSGHNHQYERFDLQRPDGTLDTNGIRQFVAGTGGSPSLYLFTDPPTPHSQVRWMGQGVLRFTLSAGHYHFEFIPIDGSTFTDSGSSNCHGPPATTGP